jgi:hypothetical protein
MSLQNASRGEDEARARAESRFRGIVVPYTTRWSAERTLPVTVINRRRGPGIAFADEILADRDRHGVLWQRVPSLPGRGRPEFGNVHPGRQQRAMLHLLCQVCAGPADQNELGTLWLLPDYPGYHDDWPGWPDLMATPEPPVCQPCARTAIRLCPALRKGYVVLRVARPVISGVRGILYRPGPLVPKALDEGMLSFSDPGIRWTCAANLVRELLDCTIVKLP